MIRDDAAGRIRQILGFRTDLFNESLDAIREAQELSLIHISEPTRPY